MKYEELEIMQPWQHFLRRLVIQSSQWLEGQSLWTGEAALCSSVVKHVCHAQVEKSLTSLINFQWVKPAINSMHLYSTLDSNSGFSVRQSHWVTGGLVFIRKCATQEFIPPVTFSQCWYYPSPRQPMDELPISNITLLCCPWAHRGK